MGNQAVEISCPVRSRCGACTSLDVPYAVQLDRKQDAVERLFADVVDADCIFDRILGMDDPFHYRNKVTSPFAPGRRKGDPRILTGMYAAGTHVPVDTTGCAIENEVANSVIVAIRRLMPTYRIEPYDEDRHTGFLRHAVVRAGAHSGEVLVTLCTNGEAFPASKAFCRALVKRVPQVTTVVQSVNTRATNVILGDREHTLYGPGFILDTLCGLSFRISAHSFYQVNVAQAEALYRRAVDFADIDDADGLHVLDAYCGTGTIGLYAAKRAASARVTGVEKVAAAVDDARQNARHNGIDNAEFVAGDAGAFLHQRAGSGADAVDVLLMDPPRAGASPEFLDAALRAAPPRIVYISCNPETQVRDITHLIGGGYRVRRVQPVDMFPHTDHVETVALLTRPER